MKINDEFEPPGNDVKPERGNPFYLISRWHFWKEDNGVKQLLLKDWEMRIIDDLGWKGDKNEFDRNGQSNVWLHKTIIAP